MFLIKPTECVLFFLFSHLFKFKCSKSKRHSRTISSIHLAPNVSPPPISRQTSIVSTVPPIPVPTFTRPQDYYDSEKVVAVSNEYPTAEADKTRTPDLDLSPSKALPSSPTVDGSSTSSGLPSPASTDAALPDPVQVSVPSDEPVPRTNGKHKEFDLSPATSPPSITKSLTASPKPSKFRRVPLRPPAATSPLRPPGTHSPSLSTSSRQLDAPYSPPVHTRVTSVASVTSAISDSDKLPPPASFTRENALQSQNTFSPPRRSSSIVPPQPPPKIYSPAPVLAASTSASASAPTSTSASPAASTPSLPSTSSAPVSSIRARTSTPMRSPAPYRPGFQPKGMYRPRTDEFSELRNKRADEGRVERTKLERRLEKLIALHFPMENSTDKVVGKSEGSVNGRGRGLEKRRASSFFNIDFKNMDAGELWKGVLQNQMIQGSKSDIRGTQTFVRFILSDGY